MVVDKSGKIRVMNQHFKSTWNLPPCYKEDVNESQIIEIMRVQLLNSNDFLPDTDTENLCNKNELEFQGVVTLKNKIQRVHLIIRPINEKGRFFGRQYECSIRCSNE
jgi:hypothetical protein